MFYDGTKLLSMTDLNGDKPEIYICTSNRSAGKTTWSQVCAGPDETPVRLRLAKRCEPSHFRSFNCSWEMLRIWAGNAPVPCLLCGDSLAQKSGLCWFSPRVLVHILAAPQVNRLWVSAQEFVVVAGQKRGVKPNLAAAFYEDVGVPARFERAFQVGDERAQVRAAYAIAAGRLLPEHRFGFAQADNCSAAVDQEGEQLLCLGPLE